MSGSGQKPRSEVGWAPSGSPSITGVASAYSLFGLGQTGDEPPTEVA
jgi:hypothetical protein